MSTIPLGPVLQGNGMFTQPWQLFFQTLKTTAGTVASVSIVPANGISGTVGTPTTTPAITLALGAITPTSVAASGAVTGSNLSGTNTGDQTITLTGDATGTGTGSFAVTVGKIGGKAVNLAGSLTTVGAFSSTFTMTGVTTVTFPTTGTLATLDGIETLTNKTLTSPVISGGTIDNAPVGATTQNTGKFTTLEATSYVKSPSTTVASLPVAGTAGAGARSFVTDATATTFLSVVAGGGTNKVPVVSNGTNWLIG